jgi:hypothetical protein
MKMMEVQRGQVSSGIEFAKWNHVPYEPDFIFYCDVEVGCAAVAC